MAAATAMTKFAVPAMRRDRYDDAFSEGMVAAGGTIGILIQPYDHGRDLSWCVHGVPRCGTGAEGALLIAIARRRMNPKIFIESLAAAVKLTATVFSVGFGALTLNKFVNTVGGPREFHCFIDQLGLGPWDVVAIILRTLLFSA